MTQIIQAAASFFVKHKATSLVKACLSLCLAAPLLAACAVQPSAPTIFGTRIVPASPASMPVHMVSANGSVPTIFGVAQNTAPRSSAGTDVADSR